MPLTYLAKLWAAALISGAIGYGVKLGFSSHHPVLRGIAVIGAFGLVYFPLCHLFGVKEAAKAVQFFRRKGL